MKKNIAIILSVIFILIGCSSEKDRIINQLKSEDEEMYIIVVFADELPGGGYQSDISNAISDDSYKIFENISEVAYIILEGNSHKHDYKNTLQINETPEIFIFDNKGIVFRTTEIEELGGFFK
ncbi:hypothetical protein BKP35_13240 [Anaerobacillus arseniciselenatis]|uniref:Lipoprotein n=1 Tax=Anaerobacillus arseniciselenatis TaxID=85682 RepID=A0A1S2LDS7_9BACI|nr:hypothetical protein [Anaerobacillus arseniciselenatis]OIJ10648.1 hypothetical protein BKP35_13240 [Anaerobacillus arseniciselenatis]